MNDNNNLENKYNSAIGIFWGASFFLATLVSIILGFGKSNWIEAVIIGLCVFLIAGLSIQGLITLFLDKQYYKNI